MKKILFISSNNTGHGHKSITQSLFEQFEDYSSDFAVTEVDGFSLGGTMITGLGNLYNFVAVFAPHLWGAFYKLGNWRPFKNLINLIAVVKIKKDLIRVVEETQPDVIVTVHPGFVGSVISVLEKKNKKIPVMVIVADLDNISYLWADKRSLYTLCPTKISADTLIKLGVAKEKIKIFGFPVRQRFNMPLDKLKSPSDMEPLVDKNNITFLIMNGSQGVWYSTFIANTLLNNFNCKVIILAGKDSVLKKSLESKFNEGGEKRVTVCGFVENVEEYMLKSDILILRASPNVLMESINLCKPVIVTGAFAGQEEKNPEFVEKNKLGIVCTNIKKLPEAVNSLFENNSYKLNEIYNSQLSFRQPNAAKEMAQFIMSAASRANS